MCVIPGFDFCSRLAPQLPGHHPNTKYIPKRKRYNLRISYAQDYFQPEKGQKNKNIQPVRKKKQFCYKKRVQLSKNRMFRGHN